MKFVKQSLIDWSIEVNGKTVGWINKINRSKLMPAYFTIRIKGETIATFGKLAEAKTWATDNSQIF